MKIIKCCPIHGCNSLIVPTFEYIVLLYDRTDLLILTQNYILEYYKIISLAPSCSLLTYT